MASNRHREISTITIPGSLADQIRRIARAERVLMTRFMEMLVAHWIENPPQRSPNVAILNEDRLKEAVEAGFLLALLEAQRDTPAELRAQDIESLMLVLRRAGSFEAYMAYTRSYAAQDIRVHSAHGLTRLQRFLLPSLEPDPNDSREAVVAAMKDLRAKYAAAAVNPSSPTKEGP